jgi:hypothetical protein
MKRGTEKKTTDNVIIDNNRTKYITIRFHLRHEGKSRYPDPGSVSKSNVLTRTETSYNYNEANNDAYLPSVFQYEYTYNDYGSL